jgi:hypothetical protein
MKYMNTLKEDNRYNLVSITGTRHMLYKRGCKESVAGVNGKLTPEEVEHFRTDPVGFFSHMEE